MKNRILRVLAFCLLFSVSNFAMLTSVIGQDVEWQYDIRSGVRRAEAENKLVLLHFTASWCRPCQALEKFVFANLEVARAINENVVPVHIDVDKQQALVTEYGVTAVPFDVIITPGGRTISKQKSPLDSSGYRRLMSGLATPVKALEDQSKIALAQKLNEFSSQFDFKPPQVQISEFKDHTPAVPSHQPPVASAHSAELARRSNRVENPFFGSKESPSKQAPKAVSNSFTVSLEEGLETSVAKAPPLVSNSFAAASQNRSSEVSLVNGLSLQPATQEIKLEPPVIKSEFTEITGAEQEEGFLARQKAFNQITPKVSPELSFQDNTGPKRSQLIQPNLPKTKAMGVAANVPPLQVQQDRFFQSQAAPGAKRTDQTRVVAPSNSAQALLNPVQQRYPIQDSANTPAFAVKSPAGSARVQQLLQPQPQPQSRSNVQPPSVPGQDGSSHKAFGQLATSKSTARSEPSLGLKGKCPVTVLLEGKWVQGDAKFGCIHRDRLYIFADAQKLKMFQANPDYFSPILAGYDPVVFHQEGRLVNGLAEHGVFMGKAPDQRILLFRDAQTRALFQAEPAAYMNSVRQAMNATGGVNGSVRR